MIKPLISLITLAVLAARVLAVEPVVVFNELQYHPTVAQTEGEWVELHSQHAVDVDLSGWRLDGGVDFVFPAGTVIPGGGYLIIAANPGAFTAAKGVAALGPFTNVLADSGESVTLKNKNSRLMDEVAYDDRFPWPVAADGSGATLSKTRETSASSEPQSWRSSIFFGGTPGVANSEAPSSTPAPVYAQRYYPFEGTVLDASANARHGVVSGATYSSETPTVLGTGQSLKTDGVDDLVNVADETDPTAYTIAMWVKADVIRAQSIIVRSDASGPTSSFSHQLRMSAAGKFEHYTYDGTTRTVTGTTVAVAGTWYHVAITAQNGGAMRLYVNGVEEGPSLTIGSLWTGGTRWLFGSNSGGGMAWFDGRTDDLTIWHTVLSGPDIQSLASGATNHDVPLVINELTASGAASPWLELRNHGTTAFAVGDYVIAGELGGQATIPAQTLAAGGFLTLSAAQLGFTPVNGERLFLYNPGIVKVLDAARVKVRHQARRTTSAGLLPGEFLETVNVAEETPGAANNIVLPTGVVINEIMYHRRPQYRDGATPFVESADQWIELFNRSGAVVDLSGWQLAGGISFTFPAASSLAPGAFIVIAKDVAAFNTAHPGVTALGPFSGNLSDSGERVALQDTFGNMVNEVFYRDHRPWPQFADAGGSSLELRNPFADNSAPEAWAASDETARSGWQNYTFDQIAVTPTHTPPINGFHELRLGLLDTGEALIDDVSVIENPAGSNRQLMQNGSFTSGTANWRLLGTHDQSSVVSDGGGNVLKIVASSTTNYHPNGLETSLKAAGAFVPVVNGSTYRISFRAKWLRGSPQLHCELYYNKVAKTVILAQPTASGTPGAVNSTFATNLGPTFADVRHSPVIPSANQAIAVSARASDAQGVASIALKYSVNGAAFATVAMALGADGRWAGTIPGQAANAVIQFYLEGLDANSTLAAWPAAGVNSRALIQVQDGRASAGRQTLRMTMTAADANAMYVAIDMMSQARRGCTIVQNENEVFYDTELRLHGSMYTRSNPTFAAFNLYFPADHRFRGVADKAYFRLSGRNEIVVKHLINAAGGIPENYDDIAWMIGPVYSGGAVGTGPARLEITQFDSSYFDDAAPDGSTGAAFKMEGIRVYPALRDGAGNFDPETRKNPSPNTIGWIPSFDLTNQGDGGTKPELYRHSIKITSNRASDDFTKIVAMCQAFSQPAGSTLDQQVEATIDVDQWMRVFALQSLCGIGDAYAFPNGNPHNINFYSPPGTGKVLAIPWDWNGGYVFYNASNTPLLPSTSALAKIAARPKFSRLFYGHVRHLCQTAFASAPMTPWINHYAAHTGENFSTRTGDSYSTYIAARSSYALGALPAVVPFNITTNGGAAFSTLASTTLLAGDGWINVREIRLSGSPEPLPLTWLDADSWTVTVPVASGANTVTLIAYDHDGAVVGTDSIVITGSGGIVPASPANVVVSELMYKPATSGGTEFIELMNIGVQTIDLTGCSFTAGVDFAFTSGTTLAAGARLVIQQAQFLNSTGLKNDGELLTLTGPSGTIRSFTYDDAAPWPLAANGQGPSLVLLAPGTNPNHSLAANWRASTATGGNPGSSDAVPFIGNPSADDDADGLLALIEYALGTSDAQSGSAPSITFNASAHTYTVDHARTADDAILAAEASADLLTWRTDTAALTQPSTVPLSATQSRTTWQLGPDFLGQPKFFFRVRATLRQ